MCNFINPESDIQCLFLAYPSGFLQLCSSIYSFLMAKLLGALQQLSEAEGSSRMKKVPLFEHEIPLYRKRPTDWVDQKPTR